MLRFIQVLCAVVLAVLVAVSADAHACGGYGPEVDTEQLNSDELAAYTAATKARTDAYHAYYEARAKAEAARASLADLTAKGGSVAEVKAAQEALTRFEATLAAAVEVANQRDAEHQELEFELAEAVSGRKVAKQN
jgi:aminopeptidase N